MNPYILTAIGLVVLDLVAIGVPIGSFFIAYVLIAKPKWVMTYIEELYGVKDRPAKKSADPKELAAYLSGELQKTGKMGVDEAAKHAIDWFRNQRAA